MQQHKKLSTDEIEEALKTLQGWKVFQTPERIEKDFSFKDFTRSIAFVNLIACEAEKRNHHPDIEIRYNQVKVKLSTHSIKGLSQEDFYLADKIDACLTL